MQGLYKQAVLADNPSLYWRLGAGGDADQSPNDRDGVAGGVTLGDTAGLLNSDPDASTTFVGAANNSNVTADGTNTYAPFVTGSVRTVEIWVKSTDNTGNQAFWGSAKDASTPAMLRGSSTNIQWLPRNGGITAWAGARPAVGVLAHLVLITSQPGLTAELFKNGVSLGSQAWVTDTDYEQATPRYFQVGSMGKPTVSGEFMGVLDEPAVYEYALSAAQIHEHYLIGSGRAFGGAFASPGMAWR